MRPRMGWASLTHTEAEVVELLLGGRTNRMIGDQLGISRRTVETHLAHVFGKLGMRTRVELAAEAARRGGSDPPVPHGTCPTCHRAA
jgi:DNA-binding CsgD family transcriptional regulator